MIAIIIPNPTLNKDNNVISQNCDVKAKLISFSTTLIGVGKRSDLLIKRESTSHIPNQKIVITIIFNILTRFLFIFIIEVVIRYSIAYACRCYGIHSL